MSQRGRVLTRHDAQKGVALGVVSPLIDEGDCLAIAFVDGSGPFEDCSDLEAIEPGIAVMPLVDLDSCDRVAIALVGQRVELAVAAIFAAAVDELATAKFPGVLSLPRQEGAALP